MGVPTSEFEILGVFALQVVAHAMKTHSLSLVVKAGVVVGQFNLKAHDKTHSLPPLVVCGSIGDVSFCGC